MNGMAQVSAALYSKGGARHSRVKNSIKRGLLLAVQGHGEELYGNAED